MQNPMRFPRLPALCAVLLSAVTVSFGLMSPALGRPAQHMAAAATSARMLPATSVRNKVTLPQASIDNPALSSVLTLVQGQSFSRSVIAWIGTDAAHRLNVERSAEGLTFFDKRTLGQTSPFRPDGTQIGQPEGGFVTLAWTGTDANHSLNILPITVTGTSLVPGTKTILSQFSSNAGPTWRSAGGTPWC